MIRKHNIREFFRFCSPQKNRNVLFIKGWGQNFITRLAPVATDTSHP